MLNLNNKILNLTKTNKIQNILWISVLILKIKINFIMLKFKLISIANIRIVQRLYL